MPMLDDNVNTDLDTELDTDLVEDTVSSLDDADAFDLDMELEGVRPSAEIVDPIPGNHICYVRPFFAIDTMETDEGNMLVGRIAYEVLATESQPAMELVGGLLSEMVKLGGAVPEYEKYSAAKQVADGKKLLVTRLTAFCKGLTDKTLKPSEMMELIEDSYDDTDESGICAKVRISAKQKGEYVNIRRVKVINPSFPLLAAEGEDSGVFSQAELDDWNFYVPFNGEPAQASSDPEPADKDEDA